MGHEILDRLKHATRKLEVTKTAFVTAAILQLADQVDAGEVETLDHLQPPHPRAAAGVVSLPGILDGLNDHQIWTLQNLAEILKKQPQGAIFRNLDLTLELAVTEYRKTKGTHDAAEPKTPRESSKPAHRKPTGTGHHH